MTSTNSLIVKIAWNISDLEHGNVPYISVFRGSTPDDGNHASNSLLKTICTDSSSRQSKECEGVIAEKRGQMRYDMTVQVVWTEHLLPGVTPAS